MQLEKYKDLHCVEQFFITFVALVLADENVEFINQFRFDLKSNESDFMNWW